MKWIYKTVLTLNATMLFWVTYCIQKQYKPPFMQTFPGPAVYLIYILFLVFCSFICLLSAKLLSKDNIAGEIADIEEADNGNLSVYLGYCFLALGIGDISVALYVFCIIFIFTMCSQSMYYNPLFLLFGYKSYLLTTETGMKLLLITRKEIRTAKGVTFERLRRINNRTFIDVERKK